ncbi:MAG: low molecular weight protein-tyrosine-phosphatase [Cyanobacteriota bacterium]
MAESTASPQAPTRVLFVCLGNICRSPAAEGLFLHRLDQQDLRAAFEVDSAGTGSWHVGKPADRRMLSAARARGVELPSRARQITAGDLDRFDHILAMDAMNLEAVRALAPAPEIRARIEPMTAYCRRFTALEVPDPYYGGPDGFNAVLDLLEDACDGLLESLLERRRGSL